MDSAYIVQLIFTLGLVGSSFFLALRWQDAYLSHTFIEESVPKVHWAHFLNEHRTLFAISVVILLCWIVWMIVVI